MTKLAAYILGFVLSVILTLLPLGLLWVHDGSGHTTPSHGVMYATFVLFAVLQLFVQLYFFLHMGEEARPRWNLMALCFALVIVAIVVGGTLWIMNNLSRAQEGRLPVPESRVPFIEGAITPAGSND